MRYYPICLRVADRPCVVIGGGKVAEHKTAALLKAGARVTVISPDVTPSLARLIAAQRIQHHRRPYTAGDLRGAFLAFAATDDAGLHRQVAREARDAGVLLNVVDRPELCDFIMPAVTTRGDLVIATSTSGASPALASRIRRSLDERFGHEYAQALRLLRRLRVRLSGNGWTADERRRIFAALVDSPLLDYLRTEQAEEVDRLLAQIVGEDISLADLGLDLGAP
jgi:precorrin-2 dehydrogenase